MRGGDNLERLPVSLMVNRTSSQQKEVKQTTAGCCEKKTTVVYSTERAGNKLFKGGENCLIMSSIISTEFEAIFCNDRKC